MTQTNEPDSIDSGEALVRVRAVGICGTDIHAFHGTHPFIGYPRILGHELGVEIVEIGPNSQGLAAGDRCAIEPYLTCGQCTACRRDLTNCCTDLRCIGVHVDGGMRDLIRHPIDKLHRSRTLGVDQLALIETLGIGKHAVDRSAVQPGDSVAVLGLGPIGMTVIQFAVLRGATVRGIDLSDDRCRKAQELFQIETLPLRLNEPLTKQWCDHFDVPPRMVFDATGNLHSMQNAFDLPDSGGTLVSVGVVVGDLCYNVPEFHRKELTLRASRNATGPDFHQIIDLVEQNKINLDPWITHRGEAESLPEFFPAWITPEAGMLKGMICF